MADLVKKIKIKKQDGTFTDYIPIGAEAQNISTSDGISVENKLNKKPYYFNNVADMKAYNLKDGDCAITLGYYAKNDGGSATYKIRTITNEDVVDDMTIISLADNTIIAELIIKDEMSVHQFGAKGDGITNDSLAIQTALNTGKNISFSNLNYCCHNIHVNYDQNITFNNATLIKNDVGEFFILDQRKNMKIENVKFTHLNNTMSGNNIFARNVENIIFENVTCIFTSARINTAQEQRGCWGIVVSGKNIQFNNCYIENNVESLWTDGIHAGVTKNLKITNCTIKSGDDIIALFPQGETLTGNNPNDYTENVIIENCYLYSPLSSCLKIGTYLNLSKYTEKGVYLNNCDIYCDRIITQDEDGSRDTYTNYFDITFNKCNIQALSNNQYYNSDIYIDRRDHGDINIYNSTIKNNNTNGSLLWKGTSDANFTNLTIINSDIYYNNTNATHETMIHLGVNSTFKLIDSKFEYSCNIIFDYTNIYIINSNIKRNTGDSYCMQLRNSDGLTYKFFNNILNKNIEKRSTYSGTLTNYMYLANLGGTVPTDLAANNKYPNS